MDYPTDHERKLIEATVLAVLMGSDPNYAGGLSNESWSQKIAPVATADAIRVVFGPPPTQPPPP